MRILLPALAVTWLLSCSVATQSAANLPPVANPGGPYLAIAGFPMGFNGTGSYDPDGDPLTYDWDLDGDGLFDATGPTPTRTYSTGGYLIILRVTDPLGETGVALTTLFVDGGFEATCFTTPANAMIRVATGRPFWCIQIEPVIPEFQFSDVILSSIQLGTPLPSEGLGFAEARRTLIGGDEDGDGLREITACFSKEELRELFYTYPPGKSIVTARIEAQMAIGPPLRGDFQIIVDMGHRGFTAAVAPNPLNPAGTLSFFMPTRGPASVRIYDLNGRLVGTLMDEPDVIAGPHSVRIEGVGVPGGRLASGVYFYKVESRGSVVTGRFVVMK